LIQKLITKEREMPPTENNFSSRTDFQCPPPTIRNENPGEPICPHLDNAGQGSEAKQKARTLDEQAEESLSFSHHALMMHLKGGKADDTTKGCPPEMQNVDCSGLWPNFKE